MLGDRVLIQYPRHAVGHERLIWPEVQGREQHIVTPDWNMYAENLSAPPLTSVIRLDAARTVPPFAPRGKILLDGGRPQRPQRHSSGNLAVA